MDKKEIIIIADYAEDSELTIGELCEICAISPEDVQQLISYEIIVPLHKDPSQAYFDLKQFKRLQSALRLQRDLDMNLAAIAMMLDLLDEVERLRAETELLKKHLLK